MERRTQLRFHYQAQRVTVQALSLIEPEPSCARIYCELHDDALLKHFDRTYTSYQVKSKERGQPKFRATEKKILNTIRNFARLHRKYGAKIRRFVIASNHPFANDNDKNDLRLLIELAVTPTASAEALNEFMRSFSSKHDGIRNPKS